MRYRVMIVLGLVLLVAQASSEGAVLVTHDEALRPYGVAVVW